MNTFSKIPFLILFSLLILTFSCVKKPDYPIEPIIKFEDFVQFRKDSAHFIFSFTDGDGDIGLRPSDTISPFDTGSVYYYNFYMNYFEKQQGEWVQIDPTIPFSYRIPYLTPEGRSKALEGEILVRIPFIYFDLFSPYDTIKYSAFIYDRALHKSNVVESREMIKIRY
jgi:hypothetical protein